VVNGTDSSTATLAFFFSAFGSGGASSFLRFFSGGLGASSFGAGAFFGGAALAWAFWTHCWMVSLIFFLWVLT